MRRKWLLIGAGILAVIVLAAAILLAVKWPFTQDKVTQDLAEASTGIVEIKNYRPIYFPHPGGVAEGVALRHGNISTPLITIERLTIRGSYWGLITRHIPVLKAEGMRVVLPPMGSGGSSWSKARSTIVIDEFVADNSVLTVPSREPGKKPIVFQIHEFSLHGLGGHHPMDYHTKLANTLPPGEIWSEGKIGPFQSGSVEQAAVAGSYTFTNANLAAFGGIAGTLESKGSFRGTLSELKVEGTTSIPNFSVTRSGHEHNLDTDFTAAVNATNGDVFLKGVKAHLDNTFLQVEGKVAGKEGSKGKTTELEFVARNGRIEDLMLLFVRAKKSPLNGEISFHATTQVSPSRGSFLEGVKLQGDFGVDAAHFTNPKTQESMNKLSKSAQGHPEDGDPTRVLSGLRGHVDIKNGTASFTNLFFQVPGADVHMHGTFGLMNHQIALHGTMQMQAKPSQATTGIKSFLMKVIDPFTNKNRRHVPIPVSITGTYEHPNYSASTPK